MFKAHQCSYDTGAQLTFFIPTLDATLIFVSFSDECFRNSLEKKSFNFQRHRISHFENTDIFPYGNIGGMQSVNNPIWRPIGLVYPKQRVNTWYISDCLASFICTCWSFLSKHFLILGFSTKKKNAIVPLDLSHRQCASKSNVRKKLVRQMCWKNNYMEHYGTVKHSDRRQGWGL